MCFKNEFNVFIQALFFISLTSLNNKEALYSLMKSFTRLINHFYSVQRDRRSMAWVMLGNRKGDYHSFFVQKNKNKMAFHKNCNAVMPILSTNMKRSITLIIRY